MTPLTYTPITAYANARIYELEKLTGDKYREAVIAELKQIVVLCNCLEATFQALDKAMQHSKPEPVGDWMADALECLPSKRTRK